MKNAQFDGLSDEAKRLYGKIRRQWKIVDEPGRTILLTAMQCLDEMRASQGIIAIEGAVVLDRWNQKKPHPARQNLKESRAHLLQALKALDLDLASLEGK
ncbi:MAG: hypothetical protein AAB654_11145 [Acidobacteriota bacterium]